MPMKPMKPCKYLGCAKLTENKYCDEHKEFEIKERATATERGYDSKWRTARNRFFKKLILYVLDVKRKVD